MASPLSVPGLSLRHLDAPRDYARMNEVANDARVAEGVEFYTTIEQFQRFYEHLEHCDLDRDLTPAPTGDRGPRASDWILGGVPLAAATAMTFAKLWKRLPSRPSTSFRYTGPERRRLPRAS